MKTAADPFHAVRLALGRIQALKQAPAPPVLPEPIVRQVHSEIGLPELFARQAEKNRMQVELLRVDDLGQRLLAYLQAAHIRKVAYPVSPFLQRLEIPQSLASAGVEFKRWDQVSADELFDFDAGLTDVHYAVAESGSMVIRPCPEHGRALSLVPPIHIAIVEPTRILPDLLDLFDRLGKVPAGSGTTLITGPSKTSDIEMNMVTGVHGPGVVKVFVLG